MAILLLQPSQPSECWDYSGSHYVFPLHRFKTTPPHTKFSGLWREQEGFGVRKWKVEVLNPSRMTLEPSVCTLVYTLLDDTLCEYFTINWNPGIKASVWLWGYLCPTGWVPSRPVLANSWDSILTCQSFPAWGKPGMVLELSVVLKHDTSPSKAIPVLREVFSTLCGSVKTFPENFPK